MNQFPDLPAGSNFELDLELAGSPSVPRALQAGCYAHVLTYFCAPADLSSLPDIPLQQMDIDVGFLKFQTDLKRLIATLPRLSAPALDLRASKTDINFASDFPGAATAPGGINVSSASQWSCTQVACLKLVRVCTRRETLVILWCFWIW